ncbi:hypothetical protein MKW92_026076 [Papaver armeniacum]|nr:hypothetical protein MKW92_026076 [Papaver armeniacum]
MRKKPKGIVHILNTFDPVNEVFQLEGMEFKSTPEHLAVIFGLRRTKGANNYTIKNPEIEISCAQMVFSKTYLKGETLRKDIIDSLYATAEDVSKPDDFVKLLVLYFCIAIFFPEQSGGKLPSKILNYIFAMDQVSWPDLIHSYLMEALKKAEKPYMSASGCIVYILFWFAEITHFISKNEGEQGKSKPRFLRWNTMVLTEKIVKEGLTSMKQDLTGSFIDSLDEGEQRLITPTVTCRSNSDRIGKTMVRDRESDENWDLSPDRDAARSLEDLVSVCLSKKRKVSMVEPLPREGKGICNDEPEHLPSSELILPADPNFQESVANENEIDIFRTSVKDSHGKDVHIGNLTSCSEEKTTGIESLKVGELVDEPMDVTTTTSSSECLTPDSTFFTRSTSVDVIPFQTGSTSASTQERVEGFEFVDNLEIPEEYVSLYKMICGKYGHMATRKVIKFSDTILVVCVINLLKVISAMETTRGAELSEALLERWEGFIKDAETLEFDIKWLREGFNRLRNHWRSSFGIDKEVENHEQVLDAMQVKYVFLLTREEELNAELSEVKIQKRKAEATISSERKAIQEKMTEKNKFCCEPVLGIVLS